MKVGVISDTHIPVSCNRLPKALIEGLKGVDLIVHAGDLVELFVLDELSKIARVEAVCGNMDSRDVKRQLPEKKVLKLGKFNVGLIHGEGAPDKVFRYVQDAFKEEELDCIIYGHAHNPIIEIIDDTIYFNPGSPTDKIFAPFNSYGIIEVEDILKPKLIRL